ncbi:MFS transporter [Actinoplanes sp. NBRC 103695]|uniref:MFS transporter n=1 Tax=Actinoplanes sp. NBRC 103695 TaxID=3032202 RepID=UPI002555583B|nr:MFS transporter [Actinoplanes sp. NBRC 103695]
MSVALVAGFMTLLDVSIVNVALPSIRTDLDLSAGELQWVLSGYALTFGLLLVPAGRFGDARGRRNVFIVGVALFTLSSAAAGLAQSALFLVVARLIQGAAAGVVNPQVSGLIQQLFEPRERGRPFGLLGATIGVSTAVGPLLGGLLIALFGAESGWRWIFYINVPIGVAAIVLAMRYLPGPVGGPAKRESLDPAGVPVKRESPGPAKRESLDPVGVLLLGTSVLLLLIPLVQEREWHGPAKWLLIPAGLAVLAGFLVWERRHGRRDTPVIDLELFRVRSYALGALIGTLYFAGFPVIFFTYTLYLQNGLGLSALASGLAVTPFAVGAAAASALGGRLVARSGRPLVVTGLVMVAAGLGATVLVLALVAGRGGVWAATVPLLLAGLGSGLVISPNQTLTLAEVPVKRAGSAGAVLQTGQRIGTALGIAVAGTVFFARLADSGNDWVHALRAALFVSIGFVLVALVAAVIDVLASKRESQRASAGERVHETAGRSG